MDESFESAVFRFWVACTEIVNTIESESLSERDLHVFLESVPEQLVSFKGIISEEGLSSSLEWWVEQIKTQSVNLVPTSSIPTKLKDKINQLLKAVDGEGEGMRNQIMADILENEELPLYARHLVFLNMWEGSRTFDVPDPPETAETALDHPPRRFPTPTSICVSSAKAKEVLESYGFSIWETPSGSSFQLPLSNPHHLKVLPVMGLGERLRKIALFCEELSDEEMYHLMGMTFNQFEHFLSSSSYETFPELLHSKDHIVKYKESFIDIHKPSWFIDEREFLKWETILQKFFSKEGGHDCFSYFFTTPINQLLEIVAETHQQKLVPEMAIECFSNIFESFMKLQEEWENTDNHWKEFSKNPLEKIRTLPTCELVQFSGCKETNVFNRKEIEDRFLESISLFNAIPSPTKFPLKKFLSSFSLSAPETLVFIADELPQYSVSLQSSSFIETGIPLGMYSYPPRREKENKLFVLPRFKKGKYTGMSGEEYGVLENDTKNSRLKPLETVLRLSYEDGYKRILLKSRKYYFCISLEDNKLQFSNIPYTLDCHRVVLYQSNDTAFLRCVLFIKNPIPLVEQRYEKLSATQFKESSQTLAKLMELESNIKDHEKLDVVSLSRILYCTSSELLSNPCFPVLDTILKNFYAEAFSVTKDITSEVDEIKHMIFQMFVSSKEIAAVVSNYQIYLAWEILKNSNNLRLRVSFESANLDAIKNLLHRFKSFSGVVFIVLRVTGQVAPLDLKYIINSVKNTSVRLLIENNAIILRSLKLTGCEGVKITRFISKENSSSILSKYDTSNVVGKAVIEATTSTIQFDEQIRGFLDDIKKKNEYDRNWNLMTEEHLLGDGNELETQVFSRLNQKSSSCNYYFVECEDINETVKFFRSKKPHLKIYHFDPISQSVEVFVREKEKHSIENSEKGIVIYFSHLLSNIEKQSLLCIAKKKALNVFFLTTKVNPGDIQSNMLNNMSTASHASLSFAGILTFSINPELLSSFRKDVERFRAMRLVVGTSFTKEDYQIGSRENLAIKLCEKSCGLSFDTTLLFLTTLDEIFSQDEKRQMAKSEWNLGSFQLDQFLKNLALLLYIVVEKTESSKDISFDQFVSLVPICQLLPQEKRLYNWFQYLSSLVEFDRQLVLPLNSFLNVHSHNVLVGFSDKGLLDSDPCFYFSKNDDLIDPKESVMFESIQGNDLDYHQLAMDPYFPYNLDTLMGLILVTPFPLKLLSIIHIPNLYELLQQKGLSRYKGAINKIIFLLKSQEEIVKVVPEALKELFSILRWSLWTNSDGIDIDTNFKNYIPSSFEAVHKYNCSFEYRKELRTELCALDSNHNFFRGNRQLWKKLISDISEDKIERIGSAFVCEAILAKNENNNSLLSVFSKLLSERGDDVWPPSQETQEKSTRYFKDWQGVLKKLTPSAWSQLILASFKKEQVLFITTLLCELFSFMKDIEIPPMLKDIFIALSHHDNIMDQQQYFFEFVFYNTEEEKYCLRQYLVDDFLNFKSGSVRLDIMLKIIISPEEAFKQAQRNAKKTKCFLPVEYNRVLLETISILLTDEQLISPDFDETISSLCNLISPAGFKNLLKLIFPVKNFSLEPLISPETLDELQRLAKNNEFSTLKKICWCSDPTWNLDFPSDEKEKSLLIQIIHNPDMNFAARVEKQLSLCSPMAIFFVKPSRLPLNIFEYYYNQVNSKKFTKELRRMNDEIEFPLFKKPLSQSEIDDLKQSLENWFPFQVKLKFTKSEDSKKIFQQLKFNVLGVSVDKFKRNLMTLYRTQFLNRYEKEKRYIQIFIWTWLFAMGIKEQDVKNLFYVDFNFKGKYFSEQAKEIIEKHLEEVTKKSPGNWVQIFEWDDNEKDNILYKLSGNDKNLFKAIAQGTIPGDPVYVERFKQFLNGNTNLDKLGNWHELLPHDFSVSPVDPQFHLPTSIDVTLEVGSSTWLFQNPDGLLFTKLQLQSLCCDQKEFNLLEQPEHSYNDCTSYYKQISEYVAELFPKRLNDIDTLRDVLRPFAELLIRHFAAIHSPDNPEDLEGQLSSYPFKEEDLDGKLQPLFKFCLSLLKNIHKKLGPQIYYRLVELIGFQFEFSFALHNFILRLFMTLGLRIYLSRQMKHLMNTQQEKFIPMEQIKKIEDSSAVPPRKSECKDFSFQEVQDFPTPPLITVKPVQSVPYEKNLSTKEVSKIFVENPNRLSNRKKTTFNDLSKLLSDSESISSIERVIFRCEHLLKLKLHTAFAEIQIVQGDTLLLVKEKVGDKSLYSFQSIQKEFNSTPSSCNLVTTFPTPDYAWDFLQRTPEQTVLFFPGVVMVKQLSKWKIFINSYKGETHQVPVWTILQTSLLTSIELNPIIRDIFYLITDIVAENNHVLPKVDQPPAEYYKKVVFPCLEKDKAFSSELGNILVQIFIYWIKNRSSPTFKFENAFDKKKNRHVAFNIFKKYLSPEQSSKYSIPEILHRLKNSQVEEIVLQALEERKVFPFNYFYEENFSRKSRKLLQTVDMPSLHEEESGGTREYNLELIDCFGSCCKSVLTTLWFPSHATSYVSSTLIFKTLSVVLPVSLFSSVQQCFCDGNEEEQYTEIRSIFSSLETWFINFLRSGLDLPVKREILHYMIVSSKIELPYKMEIESELNTMAKVRLFALAQQSPLKKLKDLLVEQVDLDSIHPFCERKDMYGVHFVPRSSKFDEITMQQSNLEVELLDFTQLSIKDVDIYSRILKAVAEGACFVFIKGLRTMSDTLLKWICELTKHNPWLYVYLQEVDTVMNLVEILDRSIIKDENSLNKQGSFQTVDWKILNVTKPVEPYHINNTDNQLETQWNKDWKNDLSQRIIKMEDEKQSLKYCFIVGAPGIGKTYYIKKLQEDLKGRNIPVREHDGSSDEFFKSALADILDKDLHEVGNTNKWYIIMDEFHMIPYDLKTQFLEWCFRHPTVSLLLIGNRYDSVDVELITTYLEFPDFDKIILRCRNDTFTYIETQSESQEPRIKLFFLIWLKVTRNLFGEELTTLRTASQIKKAISDLRGGGLEDDDYNLLQKILKDKIPHCDNNFCLQIVKEIYSYFYEIEKFLVKSDKGWKDMKIPDLWESKVFPYVKKLLTTQWCYITLVPKLLVAFALLDEDGMCCSLPEFIHQTESVPKLYHPTLKVLYWLDYMVRRSKIEDKNISTEQIYNVLSQVELKDYPLRFPMVLLKKQFSLDSWQVACANISLDDLKSLVYSLKRGFIFNLKEAQEKWKNESITDMEAFSMVIGAWPPVLQLVGKTNLNLLTKRGNREIVKAIVSQSNLPKKARFAASWRLYTEYATSAPRGKNGVKMHIPGMKPLDLVSLFLWSSTNAFNLVEVNCDAVLFEQTLRKDLLSVNSYFISKFFEIIERKNTDKNENEDKDEDEDEDEDKDEDDEEIKDEESNDFFEFNPFNVFAEHDESENESMDIDADKTNAIENEIESSNNKTEIQDEVIYSETDIIKNIKKLWSHMFSPLLVSINLHPKESIGSNIPFNHDIDLPFTSALILTQVHPPISTWPVSLKILSRLIRKETVTPVDLENNDNLSGILLCKALQEQYWNSISKGYGDLWLKITSHICRQCSKMNADVPLKWKISIIFTKENKELDAIIQQAIKSVEEKIQGKAEPSNSIFETLQDWIRRLF